MKTGVDLLDRCDNGNHQRTLKNSSKFVTSLMINDISSTNNECDNNNDDDDDNDGYYHNDNNNIKNDFYDKKNLTIVIMIMLIMIIMILKMKLIFTYRGFEDATEMVTLTC